MEDIKLHCPNPFCKQPNDRTADFCYSCHTFLPKRYLWLVGKSRERLFPGMVLGNRYAVLEENTLLDCYPENPPEMPAEIFLSLEAYLKLSHAVPHAPKVYCVLAIDGKDCIVLEETAIYPHVISVIPEDEATIEPKAGTLMPTLQECWGSASNIRLLNWIYQIATIWDRFKTLGASQTLFDPYCIRVDGGLIKILELRFDSKETVDNTLPVLLQHLIHYSDRSDLKPDLTIMRRLREMYERLIHEAEEDQSYLLCEWVDQEMIHHSSGSLDIEIVTQTDQGPNRKRNEDACYPTSTQKVTVSRSKSTDLEKPLLIVCDGIGGHEGGNIASNLAIETLTTVLDTRIPKAIGYEKKVDTTEVVREGIQISNDAISDRNDQEGRSDRQRMGTTVVLARVEGQRLQLAHVGDSRAYRITARACYQLTVDDDIASREVRLGYTLYRDALQRSGTGALTQALGMVSSSLLHPRIQTLFVDEDCIYLLCSDGLSDYDRIEQCWAQELIPVLQGRIQLADACQSLIEIANAQNGHDNVTVGLLYCRVLDETVLSNDSPDRSTVLPIWGSKSSVQSKRKDDRDSSQVSPTTTASTQLVEPQRRGKRSQGTQRSNGSQGRLIFLFSVLAAIGIVAGILVLLFKPDRQVELRTPIASVSPFPNGLKVNQLVKVVPVSNPTLTPNPTSSSVPNSVPNLSAVGQPSSEIPANLILVPKPPSLLGTPVETFEVNVGEVAPGAVMRVVDRQMRGTKPWIKLQICSVATIGETKQLKPGVEGWYAEPTLLSQVVAVTSELPRTALAACPMLKSK
jgi:serine/threonine protein phosphatase PrpC